MSEMRIESDSLGEIEVPVDAYYGAQTVRAVENFPVSGQSMPRPFLVAHARIKREAARINSDLGIVPPDIARAIVQAADEVIAGQHFEHFPVDVFQTGSGTSTNMNVNEVLANRAIELLGGERGRKDPVHPNDHVNAGQSSNDTIPSSLHIAAYSAIAEGLRPAVAQLQQSLANKARELDSVVKIGRTHLQDAVPVRLGQELGAHSTQLVNAEQRIADALPGLAELALGGTAVGTGLNAPPDFADHVITCLAESTGHPFVPAPDRFEALASRDAAVAASAALRGLAVALTKIANDLRWLASGPRCGLGELILPSLQPGSSIMPGKVNPVMPEMALMVAAQVIGNDAAITVGGTAGNFELNVMMPMIAHNLLGSIHLLTNACRLLAENCVDGLEANVERCRELVEGSLAMCTALAPKIGYDAAAAIAKEAFKTGRTVREIAQARKVLPADELEAVLDPHAMTEGGMLG